MDFGLVEILIALATVLIVALLLYLFLSPSSSPTSRAATNNITKTTIPNGKMTPPSKRKPSTSSKPDKSDKPSLKILWGSQTGTAEDFSTTLKNEGVKFGFNAESLDLEDFDASEELSSDTLDSLDTPHLNLVFVVATYGEGEPTDNAKEFHDWLMDSSRLNGGTSLSKVRYAVFGLGSRTYENFNAVAKKFDKRLEELGAVRLYEKGEGDDDSNLEEEWVSWKKDLWSVLCKHYGINYEAIMEGLGSTENFVRKTKLVTTTTATPKTLVIGSERKGGTFDLKNPYPAPIVVQKQLHSEVSDRSCFHVEFDVASASTNGKTVPPSLAYQPGDHLGVYPHNYTAVVDEFLSLLEPRPDENQVISLVPINTKVNNPKALWGPCTLRTACTQLLDLTNPPRKSVLAVLANYTSDPAQKNHLQVMSSSDESSLESDSQYSNFVKGSGRRGIVDLLKHFDTCKPPLDHLLEILQPLQPRYYSISSSLSMQPGRVSITIVVVKFKTGSGREHRGVCSNFMGVNECDETLKNNGWFGGWKIGEKVPIFVRRNIHFRLPKSIAHSVVMIGPGTGVAPFRGFIQERRHQISKLSSTPSSPSPSSPSPSSSSTSQSPISSPNINTPFTEPGKMILFFGCRNRAHDYLYEDELKSFESEGFLKVVTAFSREVDEEGGGRGAGKVYVQDRMRELSKELWQVASSGGSFYVCGDAHRMAPAVRQELLRVIQHEAEKNEVEAEAFLVQMQKQGRYSTDVWF